MNAMPEFAQDFTPDDSSGTALKDALAGAHDALAPRWAALHRAAGALATLTGSSVPGTERHTALYRVTMPKASAWAIEDTLGDLCAMLETGLFAVLQAREHGADGKIAARSLLARFERERKRLLHEED